MCSLYSPPESSKYYSDELWDELKTDILYLTTDNTPFLLIGDINARTGEMSEFTCSDNLNFNYSPARSVIESKRKNCDKVTNNKGLKLIDICKCYDMQIANGRFIGDHWGNFTHHNKNKGESTVDLAVISDNLFSLTDDFKVLPQTVYSDHCKIVLTIGNLRKVLAAATTSYQWLNKNNEYKWNNDTKIFTNSFNSPSIKNMLSDCKQTLDAGLIDSSGRLIQQIFNEAAAKSLEVQKQQKSKPKREKNKHPKKWFDDECLKLKNRANKLAILKHKNPWNKNLLQTHKSALKEFKKLCNSKKKHFWREEISKLDQSMDNNTRFWKIWKGLGENKTYNHLPEDTDGQEWENHFKNLFTKQNGNIDDTLEKIDMPISHELKKTFTMAELQSTIKCMNNKKAVGPDCIANEFLKLAPKELLGHILRILNLSIKNGIVPTTWCLDLISPIHKEGPKSNPSNYRGICIMNSLLKVLCSLLNARLTAYSETHKLINNEQIGFQKISRTSDHILSLKTLVNKYVIDKKGKKLYACFVDFKNAFDSVWHEGLFRKLENKGINGNFLALLKSIYCKTKCAVKINNKTTQFFKYEKGVQQGNPLSPLLFNLYVNDIFQEITNQNPVSLDDIHNFNALMYADDLIIFSTSTEGPPKKFQLP